MKHDSLSEILQKCLDMQTIIPWIFTIITLWLFAEVFPNNPTLCDVCIGIDLQETRAMIGITVT